MLSLIACWMGLLFGVQQYGAIASLMCRVMTWSTVFGSSAAEPGAATARRKDAIRLCGRLVGRDDLDTTSDPRFGKSERGRFYIDRSGEAVFLNRHHTLVRETVAAAFVDDMKAWLMPMAISVSIVSRC